jgi:hypothetical protein
MRDQRPSGLICCAGLGENEIPRLHKVIPIFALRNNVTARVVGEVSLADISRGGLFDLSVEVSRKNFHGEIYERGA